MSIFGDYNYAKQWKVGPSFDYGCKGYTPWSETIWSTKTAENNWNGDSWKRLSESSEGYWTADSCASIGMSWEFDRFNGNDNYVNKSSVCSNNFHQESKWNRSSSEEDCESGSSNASDVSTSNTPPGEKVVGRGAKYYKRFGSYVLDSPFLDSNFSIPNLFLEYWAKGNNICDMSMASMNYKLEKRSSVKKNIKPAKLECAFCKNNPKDPELYKTHNLKDLNNKIICPVLRAYNCPKCNNGGGDFAHTRRYCPKARLEDSKMLEQMLAFRM